MLTLSVPWLIIGAIGCTAFGFLLAIGAIVVITRENDAAAMGRT
jgi:hypothetical protein